MEKGSPILKTLSSSSSLSSAELPVELSEADSMVDVLRTFLLVDRGCLLFKEVLDLKKSLSLVELGLSTGWSKMLGKGKAGDVQHKLSTTYRT